jgi:hypothetical protein
VLAAALPCREAAAQGGWQFTPSIVMAMVSDSNLLARSAGSRSDVITRMTPVIDLQRRSPRTLIGARVTMDAERFARNLALTTIDARQHGAVDLGFDVTRSIRLGGAAAFSKTTTPSDLNLATGVSLARGQARRIAWSPSITYRRSPRTRVTAGYAASADRLGHAGAITTRTGTVEIVHHVSRRDSTRIAYAARGFDFGPGGSSRAHAFSAGWTRLVSRRTTWSFSAGPRIGDGGIAPELAASIAHRRPRSDVVLEFARMQSTVIGVPGAAETTSLSLTGTYGKADAVRVRLTPAVMRTSRAGVTVDVYRLGAGIAWPIGRVIVEGAYDATRQRGDLDIPGAGTRIGRQVFGISLTIAGARRTAR